MESFSEEFKIAVDRHFIERGLFNALAHNFWNFIQKGNPGAPKPFCTAPHFLQIPCSAIMALRNQMPDCGFPSQTYVTVLRVFPGFWNNKIKLIFLPDVAQKTPGSNNYIFGKHYQADVAHPSQLFENNTPVYHWNGMQMLEAPFWSEETQDDCPKKWVENYQKNIIFDKDGMGGGPFSSFQYLDDEKDETRGDTFAFQVLNRFYSLNDNIYVTNCMSQKKGIAGDSDYYHSIAFGNREPLSPLDDANNVQVDGMYFSDLGTLCPVRCNDIGINSEGYIYTSKSSYAAVVERFNKQFNTKIKLEMAELTELTE